LLNLENTNPWRINKMFDELFNEVAPDVAGNSGENFQNSVVEAGLKVFTHHYEKRYPGMKSMFESNDSKENYIGGMTNIIMRTQEKYLENMRKKYGESVLTNKFGDLAPRIMDVVRIFYPNQIAHILCSMQPLTMMTGQVVVIKPKFTNTAAGVNSGDIIFQGSTNGYYASEETVEPVGTGDGSSTSFAGTLSLVPVRPRRVTIQVDNYAVATDNGTNVIAGEYNNAAVTGTVNYTNGTYSVNFASAPTNSSEVTVYYFFDTELAPQYIREVELGLKIIPVLAKEHPLRINWSVPAQFAASAAINLDVEDTLSILAGQFIKTERDRYIINFISKAVGAPDPNLVFNASPTESGSAANSQITRRDHYKDFKIIISKAENKIIQAAGRGALSWIVASTEVATIIKNVDGFVPESSIVPIGAHLIGTVDGISIIKDPFLLSKTWIGGYNGILPGDSSIILAEWIPIYFTPTLTTDELRGRKAALSMYDIVLNMTQYFCKGEITNFI
jgi:hypothetical protein